MANLSPALLKQLVAAVEAADLYINSYDVSAPSRIKTDTRLALEEAIGAVKRELAPAAAPSAITASDAANAALRDVDLSIPARPTAVTINGEAFQRVSFTNVRGGISHAWRSDRREVSSQQFAALRRKAARA